MVSSESVAVLCSGGLDSAILCVDLSARFARVFPIHIRFGLRWEQAESESLQTFFKAVNRPAIQAVKTLHEPVAEIYGAHWSTGNGPAPHAEDPDESVDLPGRNLLLISKGSLWCKWNEIKTLAMGTLASNPFPDNSEAFVEGLVETINRGIPGDFRVIRPFAELRKAEVLERGWGLPLELTMSCLTPHHGRHCGLCNKCGERRNGFRESSQPDRTLYIENPPNRADRVGLPAKRHRPIANP